MVSGRGWPDPRIGFGLALPLVGSDEMGIRFGTGPFVVSDPFPIRGPNDEDEVVLGVLCDAQQRRSTELEGLRAQAGLDRAFVRPPLEVHAMAGVDQVDDLGTDVSEVEAVEMIRPQLEHRNDLFAVEVEDLEAAVDEHPRQAQQNVLHRNVQAAGQFPKGGFVGPVSVLGIEGRREVLVVGDRGASVAGKGGRVG